MQEGDRPAGAGRVRRVASPSRPRPSARSNCGHCRDRHGRSSRCGGRTGLPPHRRALFWTKPPNADCLFVMNTEGASGCGRFRHQQLSAAGGQFLTHSCSCSDARQQFVLPGCFQHYPSGVLAAGRHEGSNRAIDRASCACTASPCQLPRAFRRSRPTENVLSF